MSKTLTAKILPGFNPRLPVVLINMKTGERTIPDEFYPGNFGYIAKMYDDEGGWRFECFYTSGKGDHSSPDMIAVNYEGSAHG